MPHPPGITVVLGLSRETLQSFESAAIIGRDRGPGGAPAFALTGENLLGLHAKAIDAQPHHFAA